MRDGQGKNEDHPEVEVSSAEMTVNICHLWAACKCCAGGWPVLGELILGWAAASGLVWAWTGTLRESGLHMEFESLILRERQLEVLPESFG